MSCMTAALPLGYHASADLCALDGPLGGVLPQKMNYQKIAIRRILGPHTASPHESHWKEPTLLVRSETPGGIPLPIRTTNGTLSSRAITPSVIHTGYRRRMRLLALSLAPIQQLRFFTLLQTFAICLPN